MLNEGKTIAEVARSFGITETTWYRWKNTYSGTKGPYIQGLGPENRKLKTMVVDVTGLLLHHEVGLTLGLDGSRVSRFWRCRSRATGQEDVVTVPR